MLDVSGKSKKVHTETDRQRPSDRTRQRNNDKMKEFCFFCVEIANWFYLQVPPLPVVVYASVKWCITSEEIHYLVSSSTSNNRRSFASSCMFVENSRYASLLDSSLLCAREVEKETYIFLGVSQIDAWSHQKEGRQIEAL